MNPRTGGPFGNGKSLRQVCRMWQFEWLAALQSFHRTAKNPSLRARRRLSTHAFGGQRTSRPASFGSLFVKSIIAQIFGIMPLTNNTGRVTRFLAVRWNALSKWFPCGHGKPRLCALLGCGQHLLVDLQARQIDP